MKYVRTLALLIVKALLTPYKSKKFLCMSQQELNVCMAAMLLKVLCKSSPYMSGCTDDYHSLQQS